MDKTEQTIHRASRADALMTDPLMVEAKEHIEAELWRLFKSTVPTDTDSLAQIKAMQYMHDKYLAFFKQAIQDGKLARIELDRKKTLKERIFG